VDIRVPQIAVVSTGVWTIFGTITVLAPSITERPLDSVGVFARDSTGTLIRYALSDAQGHFTMPSMARGTYHLTVDRIGYDLLITDSVVHLTSADTLSVQADFKMLVQGTSGIADLRTGQPGSAGLHENFPNPFAGSTTLTFSTRRAGEVLLDVRDLLGRVVATVVDATLPAGEHTAEFRSGRLREGIYFSRLASNGQAAVRPIVITR
jgi:serine protease AprX